MNTAFRASRDVIIRTMNLQETTRFYETVLHLPVVDRSETLVCLDAGAFRLYVEAGSRHGPVFDFLVPDLNAAKQQLVNAGCVIIEDNPAVPRCYIGDPHGMLFNIAQA
jgi:catechol 2,3-dioxygenase-like lactoylglutathione lyase family enzyme